MKIRFVLALSAALISGAAAAATMRSGNLGEVINAPGHPRESFNADWSFALDGSEPRIVDLPHDWGVEGPFVQAYPGETGKLKWWGHAVYTKTLTVAKEDEHKLFSLDFGGVMSGAKVYCNGQLACEWPYGYASFRAELGNLHVGDNEIKVEVNNVEDSSRWYPGGGIYRNVRLVKTDPVGIAHWGTVATVKLNGQKTSQRDGADICDASVRLDITLRNSTGNPRVGTVRTELYIVNPYNYSPVMAVRDGKKLSPVDAFAVAEDKDVKLVDGSVLTQTMELRRALLWDNEYHPLYAAVTTVTSGNDTDVYATYFGVRSAEFKPDGFYLNGTKTFLKGVCLHHDAGALGAAWNQSAWLRRLFILKNMGCNAIRTSHNPPAPEFLDLCDRLGFLVVDELTDTWTVPKKPNGYASLFEQWAEKDLTAMIHRDRNHPSVILWSIGNEVGEQGYPDKWHIARELTYICHREDPTRQTTAGCDNLWASSQPWHETVDVYGFNYKPHAYAAFRDANPTQPFYGSETASCISTRGYYRFPVSQDKAEGWGEGAPYQVSSYDLYAPYWASSPDYEWKYEDEVPQCAGEFVWTGFDYLGEPTPYNADLTVLTNAQTEEEREAARAQLEEISVASPPSRSSYFGICDLAGFLKDRYYLYLCRWRPELDVTHVLPHWTWPGREGEVTPVHVYTTAPKAELFVNGVSQGIKERGKGQYRLCWDDVVYQPGEIKVVPYYFGSREGKAVKTVTAGAPYGIFADMESGKGRMSMYGGKMKYEFSPSSSIWSSSAGGSDDDLIFVDVEIADKDGNMVPYAGNLLKFTVNGPAELVAVDAGDPTCHTPFKSTEINAFNGRCLAILRPTGTGMVKLEVTSEGLVASTVSIKVK